MWISIWNSEISTATGIYCGSRKLRPDGWWGWWTPWANTVAYYPLNSTSQWNDMKGMGTAYNLATSHTAPTYWTYQWVDCAYFNWSSTEINNDSIN